MKHREKANLYVFRERVTGCMTSNPNYSEIKYSVVGGYIYM